MLGGSAARSAPVYSLDNLDTKPSSHVVEGRARARLRRYAPRACAGPTTRPRTASTDTRPVSCSNWFNGEYAGFYTAPDETVCRPPRRSARRSPSDGCEAVVGHYLGFTGKHVRQQLRRLGLPGTSTKTAGTLGDRTVRCYTWRFGGDGRFTAQRQGHSRRTSRRAEAHESTPDAGRDRGARARGRRHRPVVVQPVHADPVGVAEDRSGRRIVLERRRARDLGHAALVRASRSRARARTPRRSSTPARSTTRCSRTAKTAKGSAAQVNDVLIQAEARSGCTGHVGAYLGGPWRGAQVSLIPTFVAPKTDGFFACTLAQVSDPGGTHVVTRSASLAGALTGPQAAEHHDRLLRERRRRRARRSPRAPRLTRASTSARSRSRRSERRTTGRSCRPPSRRAASRWSIVSSGSPPVPRAALTCARPTSGRPARSPGSAATSRSRATRPHRRPVRGSIKGLGTARLPR